MPMEATAPLSSWCSLSDAGVIVGEGAVPADADGLARLVIGRGSDVRAVVEMMSGAIWVRDQLTAAGWRVQIAHARKVRDVAPLACKTDKVDARLLAELCRRDLVPELWVPPLEDRELRERLRRRMHLVRMRASARTGSSACRRNGACASRCSGCAPRTQ
jgi:transposase